MVNFVESEFVSSYKKMGKLSVSVAIGWNEGYFVFMYFYASPTS